MKFLISPLPCLAVLGMLMPGTPVHAGNGGVHGGDGRQVREVDGATDAFIGSLKLNVRSFVENLRANQKFYVPQSLMDLANDKYRTPETLRSMGATDAAFRSFGDPLLSDKLLEDIDKTPPYRYVGDIFTADVSPSHGAVGGCGYADDGFPRVASTLQADGIDPVHAEICVDRRTIWNLNLSRGEVVGSLVHEHLRHLGIDDQHEIAKKVAILFDDVVTEPLTGSCLVSKDSRKDWQTDSVSFNTSALLAKPITARLANHTVLLSAQPYTEGGPDLIAVTMVVDGKAKKSVVPLERNAKGAPYWHRSDYRFRFEFNLGKEPANERKPVDMVWCATDSQRDDQMGYSESTNHRRMHIYGGE